MTQGQTSQFKRGVNKFAAANLPKLALVAFAVAGALIYWAKVAYLGWLGDALFYTLVAVIFAVLGFFVGEFRQTQRLINQFERSESTDSLVNQARAGEVSVDALAKEYLLLSRQYKVLESNFQHTFDCLDQLEYSMDGFLFLGEVNANAEFKPTHVSQHIQRHFDLTNTKVIEDWQQFYRQIEPKDRATVQTLLTRAEAFPARERVTFELLRAAHEKPAYFNLSLTRTVASSGKLTLFCVVEDETELIEAVKQAKSDDKAKSEFLATISHELRTPLNAIIGFSRLMVQQLKDQPDIRNDAQNVVSAGESLHVILNDILDYSRIQAEGIKLNSDPFDLKQFIHGLYQINSLTAQGRDIEFRLSDQIQGNPVLLGDVNRLRQVVQNLISNALKFTHEGFVELNVATQAVQNSQMGLIIRVTDTGVGMSRTELPKLFRRFSQANRETNRKYGGTGLGLAISKGLCELMGGKIDVTSEPGVGSVFEVSLTLSVTDRPALNDEAVDASVATLRVLAVDDHPLNLKLLDKFLSKKGHSVDCVTSGQEAFDKAEVNEYDLIIMDIDMPDMDGHEATQLIRANSKLNSDTFICALSGLADEASVAKSLSVGMNEHLTKPLSFDQLGKLVLKLSSNRKVEPTQS